MHIDLLETFIYLYCISPNEKIKERLAEIISVVTTKFGTEKGRIYKFCKFDWSHDTDFEGFGYIIQAAHRLLMASQIYQEEKSNLVISAKRFIDHAINYGWDKKYGGMFAAMPGNVKKPNIIDKPYWIQMEIFWALAVIDKFMPVEQKYNLYYSAIWKYICKYLTDDYHHGIYGSGSDTIPFTKRWLLKTPLNIIEKKAFKGRMWKDAYHEGRALLRNIQVRENSDTDKWLIFPLDNLLEQREISGNLHYNS